MKILIGHNHYNQVGGEDAVAQAEVDILRQHGHEVLFLETSNKDFNALSARGKIQNILAWDWSQKSYDLLKHHCAHFKPDIAHFHNTFFMMTPAVYAACQDSGVPVVQTLHNFRLLCSNALLFRGSKVCEECVGHSLFKGIVYGCYRNSKILSWAIARTIEKHRRLQTWQKQVNTYIALTEFAKSKFIEGGLPASKIVVKPNALTQDPGQRQEKGDYFVFAGRLSEEKGVRVILRAFKQLPTEKIMILGDGPLRADCEEYVKVNKLQNVAFLGHLEKREYHEIYSKAKALIMPSIWYENFPMVILEAFGFGIPVIASDLGSMREIVRDRQRGLLFKAGDDQDLIAKINILNQDASQALQWGKQARSSFEKEFSAKANYQRLITLYQQLNVN